MNVIIGNGKGETFEHSKCIICSKIEAATYFRCGPIGWWSKVDCSRSYCWRLAASRRLRRRFHDSVRRRPDAGTVGQSDRSGQQSASSEPSKLSFPPSRSPVTYTCTRIHRIHVGTQPHTKTQLHTYTRIVTRARTFSHSLSLSLRQHPARVSIHRTTREGVRVPGSSLTAAVRFQTPMRQPRTTRTHARTHAHGIEETRGRDARDVPEAPYN